MCQRRWMLLIIFLVVATGLSAQTPNAVPYTFLNNMVQPAPNAAALGKYADYPVSYYTGVPDISVPLYTLKDGGINLPVTLSYHASGIKVSELATWVGLGWVLNANGMIVRTVMGAPDEGTHESPATGATGPRGYYRDSGLSTLPLVPYPLPDSTSSDSGDSFERYEVPAIGNAQLDCEPDIFTFNFNGHAGKFVFDEKRHPQLLEDDNLKILPNYYNGSFLSFTIITPDGLKYIFGENNMYETTNPSSTQNGIDFNSVAPSSWVLTHVINPNTKDTVTFTYTPETYTYRDLGSESNLYLTNASSSLSTTNQAYELRFGCDLTNIFRNYLTTTISGLRLTTIQSKNFKIKFIANNVRNDLMSGTAKAYSLDSVKVYNNANSCIRQFALNHGYFISTANTNSNVSDYLKSGGVSDTLTDRYRLKLLSVRELSGDGLTSKPPYVFGYYETTQLPRRMSYDQDHWGYCNNWNGDRNPYFTPTVTAQICQSDITPGANRTAAFPAMEGFTLTSIQDPLGAVTNFTYEANTATNIDPVGTLVGGLRVNQITVTDNVTGIVKTRKYSYNNSGQLFHMPVYLTTLYNEFYKAQNMNPSAGYGYVGYSQAYSFWGMLRQSQSVVPLQDLQGCHIGYQSVTETLGANGEGGSIVRTYKVIQGAVDSLSSRLNITAYTKSAQMYGLTGIYGNGHFNDTTAYPAVKPQNLQYYNGYNGTNYASFQNASYASTNYFPVAPLQPDFQRGKLLAEVSYDSSGHKIDSIGYTYSHNYHEDRLIRGLKAYQSAVPPPSGCGGCQSTIYYALTFYKIHTGISHLTSTTKKTFSGSNYLTTVTNYSYESPNHTLQTSDATTDSQGNTLVTKNYYSLDYANSTTSDNVIGKMKARNLLEPVRTDSWRNGNLIGEKVTKFYDFATASPDTLIYPANIYSLEISAPLTPVQSNESITWSAPLSTLVPNNYLISKVNLTYDGSTGKLITQQLTNDKSQSIVWSHQLNLPIAIADNAINTPSLKEFYYEGFEESTATGLYAGNGHTGAKAVFAPYTVNWTLPNSRSYVISYWYLSGGKWTYQPEQAFTGSLALSGGTAYDDIRIHPVNANIITYTYDAMGDVTSTTDAKSLTTYYEYDSFQRLKNVRDKDKNILKSFCYNYAGQANGCYVNAPSYTNNPASGTYNRSCAPGYTGFPVTYSVPAGTYTSNISQQDAENQASADVLANGQNYANINGSCVINTTITLSNTTSDGYQVNFSGHGNPSLTYNFVTSGTTTIQVPVGTFDVSIYPTGAYNTHTIGMTGQASVSAPRASYSSVSISTGSSITISIQ